MGRLTATAVGDEQIGHLPVKRLVIARDVGRDLDINVCLFIMRCLSALQSCVLRGWPASILLVAEQSIYRREEEGACGQFWVDLDYDDLFRIFNLPNRSVYEICLEEKN